MSSQRLRRAVGWGLLALVLMAAMIGLGLWQLGVYDERRQDDALLRAREPAVPLADVLGPDAALPADGVGRPVTVTGRYLPAETIHVRELPGSPATYAVVTPLVTGNGSAVLVVRGAVDRLPAASTAPWPRVQVTGLLQPSQADGEPLSKDRVTTGLRIPALLTGFSTDLYAGYVVRTGSRPPEQLPEVAAILPNPSPLAGLRNLLYAVQWWVFAGFVAFMWWRIVLEPPRPEGADAVGAPAGGAAAVTSRSSPGSEPVR